MPSFFATAIRWVARSYVVYLLLCLLVVMPALNILAPGIVKEQLNRELRSELLFFNPFTLTLEARGVTLIEDSGHQPLSFDSLRVNVSLESLWETGIVLDGIYIDYLDVHVLRDANGGFHFADLIAEESQEEEPAPSGELPALTIHELAIEAHTLRFTDKTRPGPFTTAQTDFRVITQNLTTVPDRQGEGDLILTGDGGGSLSWAGDMEIAAGRSQGQLTLSNIDLRPLWRYQAESLPFIVKSGRFDATLNYAVSWGGDLQFTLERSRVGLREIDIEPADPVAVPDTSIVLQTLGVEDVAFDLLSSAVDITTIEIAGLRIRGFDTEGNPSLLTLFGLDGAESEAASAEPPKSAPPANNDEPADPWSLSLGTFALNDSDIQWRTDYLAPGVIYVTPIAIQVRNLNWPAESPAPYELALTINDETALDVTGEINVSSGDGSAAVNLRGWQLPWLDPVVNEQARTDIARGSLALQSSITLQAFAPTTVRADLAIEDFATELHETEEEAFTLAAFTVTGASIDIVEQAVIIEQIALQRPTGSLYIREDGTMNVNGIVRERPGSAADLEATAEESAEESADKSEPWHLQLVHLTLRDGRLDFADASLPLSFQTLISDIKADIRDVDTASGKPLTVELDGSIDGYAPVVIRGSGTPLADRRDGELSFNFRGVDIATMSPYSGAYAGYTIDSGTLSLELGYALEGQTLNGDNRIIISQMKLGEPVESELAIDVPLKLGIALLTDSKGVIDLSVPITGDVNSPSFSLGPIIGRAIKNVIVKAVTAPFSLLAGLVGSDDDLEHIAFAAGSVVPDSDARRALNALGEALKERPQLTLIIDGGSDPLGDGFALKRKLLREALIAEGIAATSIETQDEAFKNAVRQRYAQLPLQPSPDANADPAPGDSDPDDVTVLWTRLVESTPLSAAALQELAIARAAAAKRELVTVAGVDAARIAISYDAELTTSGVEMLIGD